MYVYKNIICIFSLLFSASGFGRQPPYTTRIPLLSPCAVARAPQLLQDFHAACFPLKVEGIWIRSKNNSKDMFISFQKLYSSIFSLETNKLIAIFNLRDWIPPMDSSPEDQMVIPSSVVTLMGQFIASISRQKQLLGLSGPTGGAGGVFVFFHWF